MIVTLRRLFDTKKRKKMKNQFKWFTLSLLIAMIFGTRAQAAETANSGLENGGDVTLLSTKVYTLVVEDNGEFYFDGKTLTKALPAHVSFFIKDSNGIEYHAADEYKNIIRAENHKKLNLGKILLYIPLQAASVKNVFMGLSYVAGTLFSAFAFIISYSLAFCRCKNKKNAVWLHFSIGLLL